MELFLNLVWLAVAIVLSVFLTLHNRTRARKPSVFALTVTIVCIVFLLFPPISISDDLHNTHCAMEDSSRKCAAPVVMVQVVTAPAIGSPAAIEYQPSQRVLERLRTEAPLIHTVRGFLSPTEGRAPPLGSRSK